MNDSLGSLVGVELLFNFLFEHDGSAGTIAICDFVLALVGVMAVLEAALASDYS